MVVARVNRNQSSPSRPCHSTGLASPKASRAEMPLED